MLSLNTHIFAGSQNITIKLPIDQSDISQGQIRKVSKMKLHELFKWDLLEHDVALASFDDELIFGGTSSQQKSYN